MPKNVKLQVLSFDKNTNRCQSPTSWVRFVGQKCRCLSVLLLTHDTSNSGF